MKNKKYMLTNLKSPINFISEESMTLVMVIILWINNSK